MLLKRKIQTALGILQNGSLRDAIGLILDNIININVRIRHFFILKLFHSFSIVNPIQKNLWKGKRLTILYITSRFELEESQTYRYRVDNLRKALKGIVNTRLEILDYGYKLCENTLLKADIVVFMRVRWSDEVSKLIDVAKNYNIPTVFDIDDLIFLPEYEEQYQNMLALNNGFRVNKDTWVKDYYQTFLNCDYATASTNYIVEKMRKYNKKALVIHNSLSYKQIKIATHVKKEKNPKNKVICYLSGTKTHDQDFKQAIPALARILSEYENIKLHVIGYLNVDILPSVIRKKTIITTYAHWSRLMKLNSKSYINIAPLDISNQFCHAKSELKYFEAAVLGIPVISSATDTFEHCIRNEENGMLASTEEEWYSAFKSLLDDPNLYNSISIHSKEDALKKYAPKAIAKEALDVYVKLLSDYRK